MDEDAVDHLKTLERYAMWQQGDEDTELPDSSDLYAAREWELEEMRTALIRRQSIEDTTYF